MLTFNLKHPYLKNNFLIEDMDDYESLEEQFREATAVGEINELIEKVKVLGSIQEGFETNRIVQNLENSKGIYTEYIKKYLLHDWLKGVQITPFGDYGEMLIFEAALKKSGGCVLDDWMKKTEGFDEYEMAKLYWLVVEQSYSFYEALMELDDICIHRDNLRRAAETIFDDWYLNEIPDHLQSHIDYDSFATDMRYGGQLIEFEFNGRPWTVERL